MNPPKGLKSEHGFPGSLGIVFAAYAHAYMPAGCVCCGAAPVSCRGKRAAARNGVMVLGGPPRPGKLEVN